MSPNPTPSATTRPRSRTPTLTTLRRLKVSSRRGRHQRHAGEPQHRAEQRLSPSLLVHTLRAWAFMPLVGRRSADPFWRTGAYRGPSKATDQGSIHIGPKRSKPGRLRKRRRADTPANCCKLRDVRHEVAGCTVVAVAEIAGLTLKPAFISNFGRPLTGLRQTFGRV
jgi:hypothetical protein